MNLSSESGPVTLRPWEPHSASPHQATTTLNRVGGAYSARKESKASLESARCALWLSVCMWDVSKRRFTWRGRKRIDLDVLNAWRSWQSRSCCHDPSSQRKPDVMRSREFSGGCKESPGMRNTWIPRRSEVLPTRLLGKESGL